jgi:hypothetical protein
MRMPVERGIWVFLVLIPSPLFSFSLSNSSANTLGSGADQQIWTKPCRAQLPTCKLSHHTDMDRQYSGNTTSRSLILLFSYSLILLYSFWLPEQQQQEEKKMIINNKRKGQQISSDFISAPATPCDCTPLRDGRHR